MASKKAAKDRCWTVTISRVSLKCNSMKMQETEVRMVHLLVDGGVRSTAF